MTGRRQRRLRCASWATRGVMSCWLLASGFACVEAAAPPTRELVVFGASSLHDVLSEVHDVYAERTASLTLRVHEAGSTQLRVQIESGAPADVFVGADARDTAMLFHEGRVHEPRVIASNRLVVAVADHSPLVATRIDLVEAVQGRIAVGNPGTAPVGRYTTEVLEAWSLTTRLRASLLPCENARQITSALASAAADVAIAYKTDVERDARLRIAWIVPDSLHSPIAYHAAAIRSSRNVDDAQAFVRFLASDAGRALFERHGFLAATHEAQALALRQPATSAAVSARVRSRLAPVWLSMRVASLATACAAIAGLAIAAWLARQPGGWRRDVTAALADLPLVLPPTIIGLGLLELCGPSGLLGSLLERHGGVRLTFTWVAAVCASTIMAFPLMVRTARAALESVPVRYVQSARTLGDGPWRAFWRVQLPLARRGVTAGVVLCFFRALGEFGATLMVAGNIPGRTQTLPLAIYSAVFEGQPRDAVMWVVLVVLFSWSGAWAAQRLARVSTS